MGTLVGIIISIGLMIAVVALCIGLIQMLLHYLLIAMRFIVSFMPAAACYILYTVLCEERIGVEQVSLVLEGVGICIVTAAVAVVVRYAQCRLMDCDAGIGDLVSDSTVGAVIAQFGPPIVFVASLFRIRSQLAVGSMAAHFITAAILCSILSVYGSVILHIIREHSLYDEDLFDTE